MDSKIRAELIRQGNQAFNEGDMRKARDLFTKAAYKGGLVRMGDYYMFEKRLPLLAYGYYKKAGAKEKIQDLHRRMILAIGEWVGRDKLKQESLESLGVVASARKEPSGGLQVDADGLVPVPVSPLLRNAAQKILSKG